MEIEVEEGEERERGRVSAESLLYHCVVEEKEGIWRLGLVWRGR